MSVSQEYSRIIKSSSLIGGAQGVNMLFGMIRIKVVALLLGPVGIGVHGMMLTIQQFASTFAGLGIGSSGVREVAQSFGSGDRDRAARTVLTLRRMCLISGGIGAFLLAGMSGWLSQLAFQSDDYVMDIALLSVVILMANLAEGNSAVIRGARRITDMARMTVLSALIGSTAAIGFYFWLGMRGIVPALMIITLCKWLLASHYAARVPLPRVSMPWPESFREAGGLIRLGIAMMWGGLLWSGVALLIRAMIARELDLFSVGIYAAAFGLSGQFVNFILLAMGADYYPSLTEKNEDHTRMRSLVNQQSEVGLLLALPGLLGTMVFAPMVITAFYSSEFSPAIDLLRWFVLGSIIKVFTWPLGFVVLAKGKGAVFAALQSFWNLLHLILVVLGLRYYGLVGVAIAFFLLYLLCVPVNAALGYWLIRFKWSPAVLRLLAVITISGVAGFLIHDFLPPFIALGLGGGLVLLSGLFSIRELTLRLGPAHRIVKMFSRIPFSRLLLPSPS